MSDSSACQLPTSGPAKDFPQLPPEIWCKIAKNIDPNQLRGLYSVNSTLLDLSSSVLYREISLNMAEIERAKTAVSILDHASLPFLAHRVQRLKVNIETIRKEAPVCLSCGLPKLGKSPSRKSLRTARSMSLSILSRLKQIFSIKKAPPVSRSKERSTNEQEEPAGRETALELERFSNLVELEVRVDPWFVPLWRDYDPWQPILTQIYNGVAGRLRSLVVHDLSVISTYYPSLLPNSYFDPSIEFPALEELSVTILEKPPSYDPLLRVDQSITLERYGRFIQSAKATLKKLSLRFTTPIPVEVILYELTEPFVQLEHVDFYMPHTHIWVSDAFTNAFRAFLRANAGTLKRLEMPSCWCRPDLQDLTERPTLSNSALPPIDILVLTGQGDMQALSYMMYYVHRGTLTGLHLPNMGFSYKKLELLASLTLQEEEALGERLTTFEVSVYALSPKLMYLLARTMPNLQHLIIQFTVVLADADDEAVPHQNRQATHWEQLFMFQFALTSFKTITDAIDKWSLKTLEIRRDSGTRWKSGSFELLLSILRRALHTVEVKYPAS